MQSVVIYGVGSPIVVDFEEIIRRQNLNIRASIKNYDCDSYHTNSGVFVDVDKIPDDLSEFPLVLPFFTPSTRQKVFQEAHNKGFNNFLSLVDPAVCIPKNFQAKEGLFVNSGVTLGAMSILDEFVFINRGASIGHHASLGRFVSIGPGAVIAGQVSIGKGSMIGAGAVVLPTINIGENTIVGAGSVVTRDVPNNTIVVGNPASIKKSNCPGYGGSSVS